MNEVDATLEVCAVIIPQNGSTVTLAGGRQAIIGLDAILGSQTIPATISTVELTGNDIATGNDCSILHFVQLCNYDHTMAHMQVEELTTVIQSWEYL